jgi:hypothetical protein
MQESKTMTKFQKAKIIVSVKYGMNCVIIKNNTAAWKEAKTIAKQNTETVTNTYLAALKVLQAKSEKDKRDYIAEFVQQSIEGEQE